MDERPRLAPAPRAVVAGAFALLLIAACTGQVRDQPTPSSQPTSTVRSTATAAPTSTFEPPANKPLVLIASGDIACAPGSSPTTTGCHQGTTASLLTDDRGADPIAVLLLGDTQYESGRTDEYASFDATWGEALRAMPGTVVVPVAGNHEWYDPDPPDASCAFQHDGRNACGFETYFDDQAVGGTMADGAGNVARIFAEQEAHPLVVIMIDAGVCEHDPTVCGPDGRSTRFLEAALADRRVNPPAACTLVAWHQARWSDVGHGSIRYVDPLWQALFSVSAAQRPDLVLNGHDHVYERMPPLGTGGQPHAGGIPEIIAGAGGREIAGVPYTGALPTRAASIDLQHFGVLRIEYWAQDGDLATSFRTESGDTVDAQSLLCRT